MWRADRRALVAARPTAQDIPALNRLFSDAFTDRYRRDGMPGISVPYLNSRIWEYALTDAGDGAMIWRDGRGDLVAFNMVHRSGSEGWMGPLAVRVDRQGDGVGRQIVQAGVRWLVDQGAATIGLETMPRTVDNIGFYTGLGFRPTGLTITLQAAAHPGPTDGVTRLGSLTPPDRLRALAECRALSGAVGGGVDFTREIEITRTLDLGDAHLAYHGSTLGGLVLWHVAPLAEGRHSDELRILKLMAPDLPTAEGLIAAARDHAARCRLSHVSLRCQADAPVLYDALARAGWQVHWTDLRMTLTRYPAPSVDGILISNWEI